MALGRLKNTSDVIEAARRIADAGSRLDKLARAIAEVCPDPTVKQVNIANSIDFSSFTKLQSAEQISLILWPKVFRRWF